MPNKNVINTRYEVLDFFVEIYKTDDFDRLMEIHKELGIIHDLMAYSWEIADTECVVWKSLERNLNDAFEILNEKLSLHYKNKSI